MKKHECVAKVLRAMQTKGHKLTSQRRLIVQALVDAVSPLTAAQVHQKIISKFPDISLDTVYRNLRLLAGMGAITQIRTAPHQSDLFEVGESHHHHLICLDCGEVFCVKDCPVARGEFPAAQKHDFQVVGHTFEVYGYCVNCRKR